MSAEATFRRSMLGLTSSYGQALTHENYTPLHDYFLSVAADEGNILPQDSNLGRVANGATYIGNTLVTTEVVMLNESFGMMPGYPDGQGEQCGSVEIQCHTLREALDSSTAFDDKLWIVATLYSHGITVASIIEVDEDRPIEAKLMTDLGLRPLLEVRVDTLARADYYKTHVFQANQLDKLQTFVTTSFVNPDWQ